MISSRKQTTVNESIVLRSFLKNEGYSSYESLTKHED